MNNAPKAWLGLSVLLMWLLGIPKRGRGAAASSACPVLPLLPSAVPGAAWPLPGSGCCGRADRAMGTAQREEKAAVGRKVRAWRGNETARRLLVFLLCWPSSSLHGFAHGTMWDDPVSASSSRPSLGHGVAQGSSQPPAPLGCPAIICPSQGLS